VAPPRTKISAAGKERGPGSGDKPSDGGAEAATAEAKAADIREAGSADAANVREAVAADTNVGRSLASSIEVASEVPPAPKPGRGSPLCAWRRATCQWHWCFSASHSICDHAAKADPGNVG